MESHASHADAHINVAVYGEACPLGPAPTSSTTASLVMGEVMTRNSKTIAAQAIEAVKMMQQYKVQGLPVVDDDSRLQGVLNFNDLLQAGVV